MQRGWLGHVVLYHAHNFGPRFPFNPRPGFMTFRARMFGEQIAPLIASVYLLNGDVNAKPIGMCRAQVGLTFRLA